MRRTNKGLVVLSISLFTLLTFLIGCEDPGSVGSDFAERPTLTFDTLTIENTTPLSYVGYSGELSYIPIGQYSDPIFGDLNSVGLFKPGLTPFVPDSVELGEDFTLKLEIHLDSTEVYGDPEAETEYSIYEILPTSNWRSNALRINDEVQTGDLVGNFTVGEEKVIVADLSETWINKYKEFYNDEEANADSSYNYEFNGLAILSNQSNTKISFVRSDLSRFLVINGANSDTTDTVNLGVRDWGFTLERTGATNPSNTHPLNSTLEGMVSITMPDSILKEDNNNKNIIRADLVFYEAEETLNTSIPASHIRGGDVSTLNLDLVEQVEPAYEYQFGNVDYSGTADEDEPYFKINITNYVNNVIFGTETRQELILGIGSSSGSLRSTLIYNETSADELKPKIIITSLVD